MNKAIDKACKAAVLAIGLALAGIPPVSAAPAAAGARAPAPASTASTPASNPEKVNVNKADAATIARVLQGIGDAKAEAIVKYREEHGDFVDVFELVNVQGVGERTVEINEDRIVLKD